ncbi:hypothetical protein ACLMJK_004862 [Lecanora helva]
MDGTIIPENTLRDMCKSLSRIFPQNGQSLDTSSLSHLRSLQNDLLRTAASTALSVQHSTAALNALCGYLELCHVSPNLEVRALPFTFTVWTQAFDVFLTQSDNNKPKPLKRLLLTLIRLILKHPSKKEKPTLIAYAISRASRAICKKGDLISIKAALQSLEQFLDKGVVDSFEVLRIADDEHSTCDQEDLAASYTYQDMHIDEVQKFTLDILKWVQYPDCAPIAGRLLATFFCSLKKSGRNSDPVRRAHVPTLPMWIVPVKQSLGIQVHLLDIYESHVLPSLLRLSRADREAFLGTLPFNEVQHGDVGNCNVVDIQLCILVARIISNSTVSKGENLSTVKHGTDIDIVQLGVSLIHHSVPAVRIAALALLVTYPSLTQLISPEVFQCLRKCIPFFHVEVNPKIRNEFISLMRNFCTRLKSIVRSHKHENQTSRIEEHLAFRWWYFDYLSHELRPSASYQKHITALKILHYLLEGEVRVQDSVSKAKSSSLINFKTPQVYSTLRALLDLVVDPFDDVREAAGVLLDKQIHNVDMASFPYLDRDESFGAYHYRNEILTTLQMAETRAADTGRADHADGVGRLYNILYGASRYEDLDAGWHGKARTILEHIVSRLEEEVSEARKDLLSAVNIASLHSHLIALRHIISRSDCRTFLGNSANPDGDHWNPWNDRVLNICMNIWEAVRPILCLDAPEGMSISDEEADDLDIGAKDALSYSWRALKESSSLMQIMVTSCGYFSSLVSQGYIAQRIGKLSLIQLSELRHRGAFSTVSITFASCCTACVGSGVPDIMKEPDRWYQKALESMAQNASSLTRRSAGLPAMITGVLAASRVGVFFNDVISDLQATATLPVTTGLNDDEARLPQVHALNCLKDVFTDARFSTSSERHMAGSLEIAASCLENEIWAIRNCGLMLFKALIRRLNGGTDTSSTKASASHRRSSALAYQKYPSLSKLVVELLNSSDRLVIEAVEWGASSTIKTAQKVYAALEVIERSGLPPSERANVEASVWRHAQSPDWSIRDKAAKTLSLITEDRDIGRSCEPLLLIGWKSQNELHGKLLYLQFLLKRNARPQTGQLLRMYEQLALAMDNVVPPMFSLNPCPVTAAAFMDCSAEIYRQQCRILEQFADCDLKAIDVGDDALQFTLSDENLLAAFKHTSHRGLKEIFIRMHNIREDMVDNPTKLLEIIYDGRKDSNPVVVDLAVGLLGYSLGAILTEKSQQSSQDCLLSSWIRMLQLAGNERTELRRRSAAVFSLRGFFDAVSDNEWQSFHHQDVLYVYVALYDTLTDDDEDVRDQGAAAVSRLLSSTDDCSSMNTTSNCPLSVPSAKDKLLGFLHDGYRSSSVMYSIAVEKLVGSHPSVIDNDATLVTEEMVAMELRPVTELITDARKPQFAVFVEEKQNLYIDNVEEAQLWAHMLINLEPCGWNADLSSALELWTDNGLLHLLEICKQESDQSLDLTSNPDVFSVFMRVILAAEVLIVRSTATTTLLERLALLSKEGELHDLLRRSIERALKANQTQDTPVGDTR